MDIALQTVDYLSNERDYIPRVAADEQLAYIESMLSLTQHYGNFQVMSFFDLSIQLSSDSKLAISLSLFLSPSFVEHFLFWSLSLQNKMQRLVRSIYNEIGLNNTGATHLQS